MITFLSARREHSAIGRRALRLGSILPLAVVLVCVCPPGSRSAVAEEKPAAIDNHASGRLLAEFRRTYALPDDHVVRRVAPPFTPGRLEYYRVHHACQAKSLPEGPDYMWFRWDQRKPDPPPINWGHRREGRISSAGMGWIGDEGVTVAGLAGMFTGIRPCDMLGDRELKWARIPGDWVIRDGVAPGQMLQGLEAVLREKCELPIRFRLAEIDRPVIVVNGKYTYRPLPGRSTVTEDRKYAYEGSDLQDYDQLEIFQHDRKGLTRAHSGSLDRLLPFLTRCLDRPVIDGGAQLPADMTSRKPDEREHLLLWYSRRGHGLREALENGTLDTAAVLKNLSKQTGLTFSDETRRDRVLLIEPAE